MTSKEFRIVMTFSVTAFLILLAFITLIAVRTGALTPPAAQAASYILSPTYYYTATVPGLLSYQGTLADGAGDPIDGNIEMTFRIYTTTVGGTPLYTETHPAVVMRQGDFAVLLGETAPFPAGLFAEPNRYLGLQVAAQPEMAPRQRFASVAFALEASNADTLDGQHAAMLVPPGTVIAYAGEIVPSGWLTCDGSTISRTQYAELFAAIGTAHGEGNGATTFNLPDYRGYFLRGVDMGTGNDTDAISRTAAYTGGNSGDSVGSIQRDAAKLPNNDFVISENGNHNHSYTYVAMPWENGWGQIHYNRWIKPECSYWVGDGINIAADTLTGNTGSSGNHSHTISSGGDDETRPINAYVIWIIKY